MKPLSITDFRRDDLFWAPDTAEVSAALALVLHYRAAFSRGLVLLMIRNVLVEVSPDSTLDSLFADYMTRRIEQRIEAECPTA